MMRYLSRNGSRKGFTLIELLVVIAIIAILIGLLLPAVQKVREAAARASSQNNLKQIGLAMHMYNDTIGTLPNNGTNGFWPSPNVWKDNNGQIMTASWCYKILPYVEQTNLYNNYNITTKLKVFAEPGRVNGGRGPATYDGSSNNNMGINEADNPSNHALGALTDYASNSNLIADGWNNLGVMNTMTPSIQGIIDGSSNTILVGGKSIQTTQYVGNYGWDWDETVGSGAWGGTERAFMWDGIDGNYNNGQNPNYNLPNPGYWNDLARSIFKDGIWGVNGFNHNNSWGGPYAAVGLFLFADGSVHSLSYTIDKVTMGKLLMPADGQVVSIP
ncbi:DUF1559 domain-containing protein [Telmatocola sphagniphila]|uniref:DUF1559 domain-containing protein n=1 Tax=Telmatocola sphagniphila TaxID=1123043 RepID=A0A8E6ES26_9BACT|nr:DUF1559 domain-containing protein [Telmatocola sphagniphila]QVL30049.1 DUF1559 domain-containing protein [Telmatocola sphagniphila]